MTRICHLAVGLGVAFALALALAGTGHAQSTFVLDPFFGENGVATYEWPASNGQTWNSADAWGTRLHDGRWAILTRLREGNQDIGAVNWFDASGAVTAPWPGGGPFTPQQLPGDVAGLARSLDSSLAIARSRQLSVSDTDFQVFRMHQNGTDGYNACNGGFVQNVAFDLAPPFMRDDIGAMTQDAFGRQIVAGAVQTTGGEARIGIARIHPQCGLDTSFNGTGKQVVDPNPFILFPPPRTARVRAVAVDHTHRILVGGGVAYGLNPNDNGACIVVRLLQNGQRDGSFGNNGVVYIDNVSSHAGNWRCDVRALAIQPDGRIIAMMDWLVRGGDGTAASRELSRRFHPNGSPDSSWDGCCTVGFGNADFRSADVAILPEDGVVLTVHNEMIRQEGVDRARPTLIPLRLSDSTYINDFLPNGRPFNQDSVSYHRFLIESPDRFLVLATSGPTMSEHRRVRMIRYRRASTVPTDVIFRNGFQQP